MILYLPIFALSLIAVFWTADRMLLNAVTVANQLRVPPLIIGAVIIGFGTSAPELAVSSIAALNGSLEIAIGNALGSNIANLAMVIGAAALVSGVRSTPSDTRLKFLILLTATALPGLLLLDQSHLGRKDGALLLVALAFAMYLLIKNENDTFEESSTNQPDAGHRRAGILLAWWMGLMIAASYAATWSAINLARVLDVSELIIGLTVIAIGTSLPELAAALVGAYRKHHEVTIGVILGSNMFNSLAVTGLPTLISPARLPGEVLSRDYPTALGLTALLWLLLVAPPRYSLGRGKGLVLLGCFTGYQVILYREALG